MLSNFSYLVINYIRLCLHIQTPCQSQSPSKFNIMPMVTDTLNPFYSYNGKLLKMTGTVSECVNTAFKNISIERKLPNLFLSAAVSEMALSTSMSLLHLQISTIKVQTTSNVKEGWMQLSVTLETKYYLLEMY